MRAGVRLTFLLFLNECNGLWKCRRMVAKNPIQ